MTSVLRDSFVGKTLSVKTGILKQSVNARAATPPSMGTRLTVKVGPRFLHLSLRQSTWDIYEPTLKKRKLIILF